MQENPDYLTRQLITYIGNKRALLPFIGEAVDRVRSRLGGRRLSSFDAFSGSGIVSRYLKRHSYRIVANDLEPYAEVINRCYLANREELDLKDLKDRWEGLRASLAEGPLEGGLIARLYAPERDGEIRAGERVFYTNRNARYLDTARKLIGEFPEALRPFFLAPLLSEASVHANTSGVFKGFHKDRHTGIGQFGGSGRDALSRILGDIELPFPVFSEFASEAVILREDAADAALTAPPTDLAYLDPPYNQHPYGSNYFMLNLIADYREPRRISPVSGIPADWQRSAYNRKAEAASALEALIDRLDSPFVLVSFNSEGFIPREDMTALLARRGRVESFETPYNAFRGSRNLGSRPKHVREYLFLLER